MMLRIFSIVLYVQTVSINLHYFFYFFICRACRIGKPYIKFLMLFLVILREIKKKYFPRKIFVSDEEKISFGRYHAS